MKECKACGQELPLTQFYTHPEMADGHLNRCKDCVRSRVKAHRAANVARIREYDRERSKTPERMTHNTANTRRFRQEHPEVYRAHNAVRDGKLSKGVCDVCGSAAVHGHHEDYSRPLDVQWLCAAHHAERR